MTSNKINQEHTGLSSNISFIYKKLLHTFRRSISLVREFFPVNFFIGVSWGILRQVSQTVTSLIFGSSSIILSICCCHLVFYHITKSLQTCLCASQICCFQMLYRVFVIVSMNQYVESFNLLIPHDHICRYSLKIQSHVLKLYFRTGPSSPFSFPFVSLVS